MKKLIFLFFLLPCISFSQDILNKTYVISSLSDLLDGDPNYPIRLQQSDNSSLIVVTENQMQLFVDYTIQRHRLAKQVDTLNNDLYIANILLNEYKGIAESNNSMMENITKTNNTLVTDIPLSLGKLNVGVYTIHSDLSNLNSYITEEKSKLKKQKWWLFPLSVAAGVACSELNVGAECLIGSGIIFSGWGINELFKL